ncbi:DUF6059 family protein [Kitasatospora sp. NPDC085879]|uniref:DUF6059 family protein n=1 Tax=Kitasatospora sp. NPDC085879 TaxID=3154769 RepID=UPI000BB14A10|nr:DUF6059 family protein [Streptomyces sp. TLI_235]PBC79141.1 hypothetical protein BX265_3936 [Streptomyces sp. TLI_235]
MWENLRVALHRTAVALGWLGLFFGPTSHAGWLPGQDTAPAPAAAPAGPPPGHPDRRGAVRLSREERRAWAELNDAW